MRWSQAGAEALLRLRCVAENGDWQSFHAFRRDERGRNVYGIGGSEPKNTLELVSCQARQQQIQCLAA